MGSRLWSIVSVAVLAQPACSFLVVRAPVKQPATDCPSLAPPIIDAAVSVVGLGVSTFVLGDAIGSGRVGELFSGGGNGLTGSENALLLPSFVVGAVFLASAIYGFRIYARCESTSN